MSDSATVAAAKSELRKRSHSGNFRGKSLSQHYWLYIMLIPGVVWMLIFCYLPMGGLVMAFESFNPYAGGGLINALQASEKVGFKNFQMQSKLLSHVWQGTLYVSESMESGGISIRTNA